jgi:hypothetical protein
MLESRNPVDPRHPGRHLPRAEISANKYMLNIRFVHAGSGQMRTAPPSRTTLT